MRRSSPPPLSLNYPFSIRTGFYTQQNLGSGECECVRISCVQISCCKWYINVQIVSPFLLFNVRIVFKCVCVCVCRVQYRDRVQLALHFVCGLLLVLCLVSLFYGKVCSLTHTHTHTHTHTQTHTQLLQWKRRAGRCLSNCLERRTSSSV